MINAVLVGLDAFITLGNDYARYTIAFRVFNQTVKVIVRGHGRAVDHNLFPGLGIWVGIRFMLVLFGAASRRYDGDR